MYDSMLEAITSVIRSAQREEHGSNNHPKKNQSSTALGTVAQISDVAFYGDFRSKIRLWQP